jgi:hypothetical protein
MKLFAFQFQNSQVVSRRMQRSGFNLSGYGLMAAFELGKMALKRHRTSPSSLMTFMSLSQQADQTRGSNDRSEVFLIPLRNSTLLRLSVAVWRQRDHTPLLILQSGGETGEWRN